MSQFFAIHPTHPQGRLVSQAAEMIRRGDVVVYPTDSTYALGCRLGEKSAVDRVRAIRRLDDDHFLTLVCRDLKELSSYARVDNASFRTLRRCLPGPFTFLLPATRDVPRRLIHPKRRTIGIRVPSHVITQTLLEALGEPLMSTSLILPGDELPLTDPHEMRERLEKVVDLVIDGGPGGLVPTTVVDLTGDEPVVVRSGAGFFE